MARDFATGITISGNSVGVLATTGTSSDLGTASRGAGTQAARADHVHKMPTPADVGAISSSGPTVVGSSTTLVDTGTVNNVSLTTTTTLVRWAGATAATITGFAVTPTAGRVLIVYNASTATLTLAHASAGSTVGYRFSLPSSVDVTVAPNEAVVLVHDGTFWRAAYPYATAGNALTSGTLAQFAATTSSQLAGVISDETGSGALVFATSPTLVTPALGTPSSATLTNATGLPISTGVSGLGTGVATFLGTPSSANLATAVTDETGSGALVFATSPTLVTPALGTPSSATLTNATGLPISTGVSGLGTGVATFLGTPSSANLATAVTDETGSGSLVFGTSPTIATPALTLSTTTSTTEGRIAWDATNDQIEVGTGTALAAFGQLGSTTGAALGTASAGTGGTSARSDHVHPTTGVGLTSGTLAQFSATTSAQLAGVISDETGSGALVFATSPALTTPNLGTPSAATLTNATGLPISTGVSGLGTGVATFLATPSSANLISAVTDETGTGSLVFGTTPTIATPLLTLSTTASTADGRIYWDSTNDNIKVGNGTVAVTFEPSSLASVVKWGG